MELNPPVRTEARDANGKKLNDVATWQYKHWPWMRLEKHRAI
jgi:hypothetical protein